MKTWFSYYCTCDAWEYCAGVKATSVHADGVDRVQVQVSLEIEPRVAAVGQAVPEADDEPVPVVVRVGKGWRLEAVGPHAPIELRKKEIEALILIFFIFYWFWRDSGVSPKGRNFPESNHV